MRATRADRFTALVSWGVPLLIVASYGLLAREADLRRAAVLPWVAGFVVLLLGIVVVLGRARPPRWSPAVVMALAAALRLAFLLRPPELSDDLYRYQWDGAMVGAGRNPYVLAPAFAPAPSPELEPLREQVSHPELVTIYPPAAELLFALSHRLGGGVLGWKALLVAGDLGLCLVLLELLRRAGQPEWRLALYAWHPLPVLELAGSGHVDGAAAGWMLLAVLMLVRSPRRRAAAAAGAFFALSVLTKLYPVVLFPALLGLAGRCRGPIVLAATGITAALLTAPFLPELRNMVATLSIYARHWEFAGAGFRTLRSLTGSGDLARLLLLAMFVAFSWRIHLSHRDPERLESALRRCYAVVLALLLCSPTLYPWYALGLAALLPACGGPFGLGLSASVFLGYEVVTRFAASGRWIESDGTAAAIVLVPLAGFVITRLRSRLRGDGPKIDPGRAAPPAR